MILVFSFRTPTAHSVSLGRPPSLRLPMIFLSFLIHLFLFPHAHTDHGFLLQSSDNAPAQPAPNQRVVEVAIPDVGTFVIQSEEGGYDDEVHPIAVVCTAPPRCFIVLPDESFLACLHIVTPNRFLQN